MAVSGSYNFTRNRDELIDVAFDLLGIKAEGESLTSQQVTDAAVLLNMFIKTLPAGGISLWRYEDIVVFLTDSKESYLIGPSGDHASASYVKTELSTAGAASDGTIEVDSITGISASDNQWTTVNGAPTGTTVTLTASLTGAAAVDNHVYTYTSIAQRPLRILDARIKINDGNETPVNLISREEYFDQPSKSSQGKASQFYYNPTTTNGTLYVWPTSNGAEDTIHLTAQRQLQDLDSATDNLDFPQEWELAVTYSLADLLITSYGDAISPQKAERISAKAAQFMEIVEDFDQENASIQFVPWKTYT
jgi:hypothetical protein